MITGVAQLAGQTVKFEWHDADSFEDLPYNECMQIYGVCFYLDKVVLVQYETGRDNLPGGKIEHEQNESIEDAFRREIKEETNMRVLNWEPIGYQKTWVDDAYVGIQLRAVAVVEPFGPFESDPAGKVIGIRLVDPTDVNTIIQYSKIGERMMQRALKLRSML